MNRLGFAVQLCLLRYPGQYLGPGDHPPEAMITFVADQVGAPPAAFADYAHRDQTRREHAAELQAALGIRRFGFADWRTCIRVGADAAWATDRGEPTVRGSTGCWSLTRTCAGRGSPGCAITRNRPRHRTSSNC